MSIAFEPWSAGLFLGLRCALGLAVVGAVCCKGPARAWWLGFAALGWISVRASFDLDNAFEQKLPAQMLLGAVGPSIFGTDAYIMPPSPFEDGRHFVVWHCLWALLAAVFGGMLAITISGAMAERMRENVGGVRTIARFGRNYRLVQAGFWSVGLALAITISFGSTLLGPPLWAGVAYFLTWSLLQLAALRSFLGHGKRRDGWLAASVLGASFLIVAFGRAAGDTWPRVFPTAKLLDELRPRAPMAFIGYPDGWDAPSAMNAPVLAVLEREVTLNFVEEAPLEDVLESIQGQTADADGKRIRVALGALTGGQENIFMVPSLRMLDLEGVPLRIGLQLGLDQIGLTHHVKDGALVIHHKDSDDEASVSTATDAYQIVGHCMLSLIAAGFGGAVTALVCSRNRRGAPVARD
jgi:hypothetical protein